MAFSKSKIKITFADDLGIEVVNVYVGPERKRYVVHKNLLIAESDYFKAALLGSFIEAEENSIHLKEEDPAAVALLIGWLYHGVIPGTESFTNPFGPFTPTMFSSTQPIEIPVSEMGSAFQFNPTPTPDIPNLMNMFQHLCAQSHYTIFSPEELRLADYKLNRRYQSDGTAIPTAALPLVTTTTTGSETVLYGGYNGNGSSLFGPPRHPAAQSTVHQTPSLFGGGPLLTPATSPPFTTQAPAFGLFTQSASQPSTSQVPSSSTSVTQPNIFVSRYGPVTSASSTNPPGTSSVSQSQSQTLPSSISTSTSSGLFGTAATSVRPPAEYSGFGGLSSSSNPNLSTSVNSPTSGSLFGTPTALNRPSNPFSRVPSGSNGSSSITHTTSTLFGSHNSVSQAPSVPVTSTSFFGTGTPSTTSTGLFGGSWRVPTFGGATGRSEFGTRYQTADIQALTLPPGAKLLTITPHKPKLGEFGSYSSVKEAKSPGLFIPGIPRADPQAEPYIDVEKQQLVLLNLCIMAETFCWPSLFNDAINAYIRGEHRLQRPIPLDFIDRIYARTHDDSTLRGYAMKSLCQMRAEGVEDLNPYMELAQKHQDFFADLLGKVMGSSSPSELNEKTLENYKYGVGREEEMLSLDQLDL